MSAGWVIVAAIALSGAAFAIGYEVGRIHAELARRRFVMALLGYEEAGDREPDGFGSEAEGLGIHAQHMRRDRVRRHSESVTTFPAGEGA